MEAIPYTKEQFVLILPHIAMVGECVVCPEDLDMEQRIVWKTKQVSLTFVYSETSPVALSQISMADDGTHESSFSAYLPHAIPLVEIMASGRGTGHWITNTRLVQTTLGQSLRHESCECFEDSDGSHCHIHMKSTDFDFAVKLRLFIPEGQRVVRSIVDVTNTGEDSMILESVVPWSVSFGTTNDDRISDISSWRVYECTNECTGEGRWARTPVRYYCPDLHASLAQRDPQGCHAVISEGTFSTGTSSPVGVLESEELHMCWAFQIEHNGPWRWEIGQDRKDGYFALSGPNWRNHTWSRCLDKGDTFTSVPVSVTLEDSFHSAMKSLTQYRRAIRQVMGRASQSLIIFNDYMNTIDGDPTTEKLLPLIDEAGSLDIDVFCIDCGWYDDSGDWWPSVGEWDPSVKRFPNGLDEVIDAIHDRGMIPGLWLEPESVGIDSPIASVLPDSCFFQHDGKRLVEQKRLMLDFRNPTVVERMNSVIDRLVNDYGIGYFKFDFNIRPGSGTTYASDSSGDGLLGHNRAYLKWIDGLYERHPDLILESCSAGGMRTDFAQASHFQLLSTSDQQDYRLYPIISTAAPMTMLPEQAGNWAYPERTMSEEEFAFALMNTMLGHYFLSGYLNTFSESQKGMIRASIDVYKKIVRPHLVNSWPVWPLGLPEWSDDIVALGMMDEDTCLLAVWARGTERSNITLPIRQGIGRSCRVEIVFPTVLDNSAWRYSWDAKTGTLELSLPSQQYAARLFAIDFSR